MLEKQDNDRLYRFSDLIELLYLAPTHSQGFQPFLELLVHEFQLCDAVLHIQNTTNKATEGAWLAGSKSDALIHSVENNIEKGNYIYDYLVEAPPRRFYTLLNDIGRRDPEQLSEHELMVEQWFEQHGFLDASSAIIGRLENRIAMLTVHRDKHQHVFSADDVMILNELVPHVQRAFTLYQQFKDVRNETSNLNSLVAQLPHGALLYDSKGEVICVNQKAIELGELHSELEVSPTRFSIKDISIKRDFISNLYKMIERDHTSNETCRVTHLNNKQSQLTILLAPIGIKSNGPFNEHLKGYEVGVIVYLYDRQHPIYVNPDFLKAIFGLTETEGKICELLVAGYNRNEIATILERSEYTIKDHLKSIFVKTGCHSQTDLIATLLSSPIYCAL
ncbi:MAG: helix-turn-helix transcriptional regulator [Pseudomonadota bacterium]